MFRGKYFSSLNGANPDAIALRKLIPEFGAGEDEHDSMAFYAVVYDENDAPAGSARLYIDDESRFRIDYLGVLPEKRLNHMGDLLARMLLYKARELNAASVHALVPQNVLRFFARYGFATEDANREKCEMRVSGDKIRLEGSCSKAGGACGGNCENCG